MKVYLDVCCLERPFDSQEQALVRLEAEAVMTILSLEGRLMDNLAANPPELRARGFKALVDALGWADAVRFLRQLEPGTGNYTEERDTILPDWDAQTLARKAGELQSRDRR